ncbi:hypothetical protein F5I97DRAFT_1784323, partial [Phlebopus sp. FC_14]
LIEYMTQSNDMGLFHVYLTRPTHIPKGNIYSVVDAPMLNDSQDLQHSPLRSSYGPSQSKITSNNLYLAFSSPTAGLLMCWQYSVSTTKSGMELNHLWSFVKNPQFDPSLEDTF